MLELLNVTAHYGYQKDESMNRYTLSSLNHSTLLLIMVIKRMNPWTDTHCQANTRTNTKCRIEGNIRWASTDVPSYMYISSLDVIIRL